MKVRYTGLPCVDCPKFRMAKTEDCYKLCAQFGRWALLVEKAFAKMEES